MNEKTTGKQMTINLVASVISFAVNVGINFFLSPFLVKEFGTEAYGFIGLANNFVQYAAIITAALNSVSGRFISVEYHRGNIDKASKIFSSVFVANLFLAGVMLIASAFITAYIDLIINVPDNLVSTVKLTFGLTFATYVVSVVTAIFTTAAFVKNRVDINSVRDIISNLIKVALVDALFAFLPAQLYYLALATLGSGLFLLVANISVKRKILPEVKVKLKNFEFGLVKTILAAGIWISFAQLCNALISGLDLLICNLTLGATMMGILSIAKTVPISIGNLINTIANVFTPHYTILYAKGDIDGLVSEVKFTSKILSFILTVPIAAFMAFGTEFYTLWQPTKTPDEIRVIQILSILTCIMYLFTCQTQCLMMVYTVCNRLKGPVLVNFGIGLFSTAIVLLLLNFGNLGDNGVYAIAGVSSVLMSLRALLYMPVYTAHILNRQWSIFYGSLIRACACFAVVFIAFFVTKLFVTVNSWLSFIILCLVAGIVGYIVSIPIMFSRRELSRFKKLIYKKIRR